MVPLVQFRGRRVWGTLSLAVTNLVASSILFEPDTMLDVPIHRVALEIMPVAAWGALFLVAGVGLVVAAITRLTLLLHIFGSLSIAGWVGICVSAFFSDLSEPSTRLSGLGLALFVWMLLGPLSMLLVPLIAESKDQKKGRRFYDRGNRS